MTDWRTLTRDELARAVSPSSMLTPADGDWYGTWIARTVAARRLPGAQLDIAYGSGRDEVLDLYLPTPAPAEPPPLVVFLHGGYWQEVSKAESGFAAPDLVAAGIAHAVPEYTLAPRATLEAIVEQATRAVTFLADPATASRFGYDPRRIVVTGHSAGAQLTVMAVLAQPAGTVAGIVPFGGVFDLEPLIGTPIDDALGLDPARARALSPQHAIAGRSDLPPAVVILGTRETPHFRAQSRAFADAYAAAGNEVQHVEVEGCHHFDLPLELGDEASPFGRRVLALARTGRLGA